MWRSLSPCVTGGSGWLRIAHCWRSAQILAAAPPSQRNPTLGSYPPPSWEPGLSLPPHKTYSVTGLPGPTAGSTTAGGTMAGGITAGGTPGTAGTYHSTGANWWYHSRSCCHALPHPHQGYPSQGMCRWHDA